MSVKLDVLFKKMQKDDKKEVIEFHILDDDVPYANELIQMAGGLAILKVNDHEKISAEFKKIQRDSKKAVLQFEVKGDNDKEIIDLYKVAGSHVDLELEPSQMNIDEFYEEQDKGIPYNVEKDGTIEVIDGQLSMDEDKLLI